VVTRKKCPDPEIENLRQAFEALDTNNTGKISFDNFLLNSGMKGEVFKGFNRRAGLQPLLACSAVACRDPILWYPPHCKAGCRCCKLAAPQASGRPQPNPEFASTVATTTPPPSSHPSSTHCHRAF